MRRAAKRGGLAQADEGVSLQSGEAGRQRRQCREGEIEAVAAAGRAAALGAEADLIGVEEEGEAVRVEPIVAEDG
jgi:hypothetical protein